MKQLINLTNHLFVQHQHSDECLALNNVVSQLMLASKIVSREVNKAGLVGILGQTDKINCQGERVRKLDQYADDVFTELLSQSPYVCAIGSEERPEINLVENDQSKDKQFIVHLDPLDGSSNVDVNVSVGTNFVIFKKKSDGPTVEKSDYLQPGQEAVCAGYIVYGSSTMLVYSSGKGVHGFTLDPSLGEFILSHPDMELPDQGKIYSINESYESKWESVIKDYIQEVKSNKDVSGQAKTARYIGSLVADFHRNLLKGGIFLYPADKKHPHGKLRLLYEGIPFAYLAEQAGGKATNGQQAVLKIKPKELHQRIPFFVGSKTDIQRLTTLLERSSS
jgi:fructose-1,6-bisphosphatase I